jgi:hypothetical protein
MQSQKNPSQKEMQLTDTLRSGVVSCHKWKTLKLYSFTIDFYKSTTFFTGISILIQAGFLLHRGYVPEKCRADLTQNSYLK